jgi:hypothetical protein
MIDYKITKLHIVQLETTLLTQKPALNWDANRTIWGHQPNSRGTPTELTGTQTEPMWESNRTLLDTGRTVG